MKLFRGLFRPVVAAPPPKADDPSSRASGRQEMASGMALFGPSPSSPSRPQMRAVSRPPYDPAAPSIPDRLGAVVVDLKSAVHAQGNQQACHWAMGQYGEGSLITNLARMKVVEFARAHVGVDYTKIVIPDKKLASTLAAEIMQRSAIVPSEREAMRKVLTAQLKRDLRDVQSTPKLSGETSIEAFTRSVEKWTTPEEMGPVGLPDSQLPALPPISENVLKALQTMSGDADFLASVKLPGVIEGLRNGVRANGLALDLVHCRMAEHLLANFGQTVHFPAADEFVAGLAQTMPGLDVQQRDELKACYQIALDQVIAITTAAGGKPAIEPIIGLMSRWAVDANLPPPPGMTWRSGAGDAHGSGSSGRSPDAPVAPPGRPMSRYDDDEEHKSDYSRSPSPVNRQPRLD